ncbi:MAG: DUF3494 domain-containing protein [Fibrella sp.]|nr:DUF3494 domain-containing protein [Armatimonadota bacterium]
MKELRLRSALPHVYLFVTLAILLATIRLPAHAAPEAITLGQAFSFGVLAGSTVTNTGPSVIFGNVGVSPGTEIGGFPPGTIIGGTTHSNDALAQQAQIDLGTAYDVIAGETPDLDLTGQDLGGLTLQTGVYNFDTSAQLTGVLTLDAQGDPNARFDFQIGSTLTTASLSSVTVINGGSANNVFFQVGSSATLGTGTAFTGNILALTSITLTTGASISEGRALARNGAVTLDTNIVGAAVVVPEPSTAVFLGCTGLPITFALLRRRGKGK